MSSRRRHVGKRRRARHRPPPLRADGTRAGGNSFSGAGLGAHAAGAIRSRRTAPPKTPLTEGGGSPCRRSPAPGSSRPGLAYSSPVSSPLLGRSPPPESDIPFSFGRSHRISSPRLRLEGACGWHFWPACRLRTTPGRRNLLSCCRYQVGTSDAPEPVGRLGRGALQALPFPLSVVHGARQILTRSGEARMPAQ
jgi:hypothetical protein